MNIPFKQSPNFTKGRKAKITQVIIHSMAGTYVGSQSWFMNPKSKVSAHYLVSQKGEVIQMVGDQDTAWHCYGFNSGSIGIELEDKGQCHKDGKWITTELYARAVDLTTSICVKYNIKSSNIKGHNDPIIQAFGKLNGMSHSDPGKFFDMNKFRKDVQAEMDKRKNAK